MISAPDRLGERSRRRLVERRNDLFLSAATSWEIAIKHGLGRLHLPEPAEVFVPSRMAVTGVIGLPIHHSHALRVSILPGHHTDPFDRMLVAQAQLESLTIMTADRVFDAYDVAVEHAR
jgi:PIN domain nuclease of toxin-antitoxin system